MSRGRGVSSWSAACVTLNPCSRGQACTHTHADSHATTQPGGCRQVRRNILAGGRPMYIVDTAGTQGRGGQLVGVGRDALEGKGPQRRPRRWLDRGSEEVAKAVGGGYCRLQMLLKPALGVRETVAGHRLGALEGGGGTSPPFQCIPGRGTGRGRAMGRATTSRGAPAGTSTPEATSTLPS